MKGDRFFGSNVRRYEDSREGYLLRCNSLEGTLSNGEVEDFTAVGSVYFLSRPAKGEPTETTRDCLAGGASLLASLDSCATLRTTEHGQSTDPG